MDRKLPVHGLSSLVVRNRQLFPFNPKQGTDWANMKKAKVRMLSRIKWSSILKAALYALIAANAALSIMVLSNFIELRKLHQEEQDTLNEIFPPLTANQVSSLLNQLFPELSRFDQENFGNHVKYYVFNETNLIGHAYQVREDIWCPVCKDVRFFIGIDTDNTISGIVLVNPFHFYGKPLASALVDEFVEQFVGKQLNNEFRLDSNIRGVTGATKTVRHFMDGILGIRRLHLNQVNR